MTEETAFAERTFKLADIADDIAKTNEKYEKDNRAEEKNEADKKLRKIAYETAKQLNPGYARESPEKMSPQEVNQYATLRQKMLAGESARTYSENLETILDKEIPGDALEGLLGNKDVVEKIILPTASDEDRKAIAAYLNHETTRAAAEQYEKSGTTGNKELDKQMTQIAAQGYAAEQRNKLKELGYSIEIQEMGEQLARAAASAGLVKDEELRKYAVSGIKEGLEKAKTEYEKIEDGAAGAVRRTLTKLGKSKETEDFQKSFELAREAYRMAA